MIWFSYCYPQNDYFVLKIYRGLREDDKDFDDYSKVKKIGFNYIKDRFTNYVHERFFIINVMDILGPTLEEIMDHLYKEGYYINIDHGKIWSI